MQAASVKRSKSIQMYSIAGYSQTGNDPLSIGTCLVVVIHHHRGNYVPGVRPGTRTGIFDIERIIGRTANKILVNPPIVGYRKAINCITVANLHRYIRLGAISKLHLHTLYFFTRGETRKLAGRYITIVVAPSLTRSRYHYQRTKHNPRRMRYRRTAAKQPSTHSAIHSS